jgi:hypothetical protein
MRARVIASDPAFARFASYGGFKSAEARSAKAEAKQSRIQGARLLRRAAHASQ